MTLATHAEVILGFLCFVIAVLLMAGATAQPMFWRKDGDA